MPSASASPISPAPTTGPSNLPLERRAGLARHTVALIRDLSHALLADAEKARERCERAGNPTPLGPEIEALVEQAELLRSQSEKLTRAFMVLDRLIPPAPDERAADAGGSLSPAASPPAPAPQAPVEIEQREKQTAGNGGSVAPPSPRTDDVVPLRPPTDEPPRPETDEPLLKSSEAASAGQEETREAASAFAVALKLEGVSQEEVESRLVREFGRPDAGRIADEAFGGRRS